MARWSWTREKYEAARLYGQTAMSHAEVADSLGISEKTIARWRSWPEFRQKIADFENAKLDEAKRYPFTRRADRVIFLSDQLLSLLAVIKARKVRQFKTEYETDEYEAEGGRTGAITRTRKANGSGENAEYWFDYQVDLGLSKEIREILKQLSQELGQWDQANIDPVDASIIVQFLERGDGPK